MITTISPQNEEADITIMGASDFQVNDGQITVWFPRGARIDRLEIEGDIQSAISERFSPNEAVEKAFGYTVNNLIIVRSRGYTIRHDAIAAEFEASDLEEDEDYEIVTTENHGEKPQVAEKSGVTVQAS
ncbi:hypothetical protein HLRTI_002891 [Halorhabdus tiamatea SARL4B]|uniref:Uncharacterized protein n=1 Tax=Halorhabdus tiamatea SARL4B TaxID=1033806 RepID=U2DGF0_9EURY|nr:hypothetical protein [Halorhabdus tiamatea]ERJ05092.1 hypothetical protein HLRTI_002891 [Halorhabdus tiamatea SARL4B]